MSVKPECRCIMPKRSQETQRNAMKCKILCFNCRKPRFYAILIVSQPPLFMQNPVFSCRPGCAACCIAPSISSPIPGMPHGKAAGVACMQLSEQGLCMIFGRPERPACCSGLQASAEMCGENKEQAIQWLNALELATCP